MERVRCCLNNDRCGNGFDGVVCTRRKERGDAGSVRSRGTAATTFSRSRILRGITSRFWCLCTRVSGIVERTEVGRDLRKVEFRVRTLYSTRYSSIPQFVRVHGLAILVHAHRRIPLSLILLVRLLIRHPIRRPPYVAGLRRRRFCIVPVEQLPLFLARRWVKRCRERVCCIIGVQRVVERAWGREGRRIAAPGWGGRRGGRASRPVHRGGKQTVYRARALTAFASTAMFRRDRQACCPLAWNLDAMLTLNRRSP